MAVKLTGVQPGDEILGVPTCFRHRSFPAIRSRWRLIRFAEDLLSALLPEHLPEPHNQLPELRLVPLLRVQIRFVVIQGVNQPPDLVLVQVDLHAFKSMGRMLSFPPISTVQAVGASNQRADPRGLFLGNCRTAMGISAPVSPIIRPL